MLRPPSSTLHAHGRPQSSTSRARPHAAGHHLHFSGGFLVVRTRRFAERDAAAGEDEEVAGEQREEERRGDPGGGRQRVKAWGARGLGGAEVRTMPSPSSGTRV